VSFDRLTVLGVGADASPAALGSAATTVAAETLVKTRGVRGVASAQFDANVKTNAAANGLSWIRLKFFMNFSRITPKKPPTAEAVSETHPSPTYPRAERIAHVGRHNITKLQGMQIFV
jgi:hypothetical protein